MTEEKNRNVCFACGSSLRPDGYCIMPVCANGWSVQEKATRMHVVVSDELLAQAKRSTPPPAPAKPVAPVVVPAPARRASPKQHNVIIRYPEEPVHLPMQGPSLGRVLLMLVLLAAIILVVIFVPFRLRVETTSAAADTPALPDAGP